jgi:hypothetical protein
MTDSNGLTPKVYRRMLSQIYLQNKKDSKAIKDNMSRNHDPICQKHDRYLSPRTRGHCLTQTYLKKMEEKPEKPHIIRIPIRDCLASGPTVVKEERHVSGKKINPRIRKNECSRSLPRFNKSQKNISITNYYKYFYLDNFNSVKQNQNDINSRNVVSQRNNN